VRTWRILMLLISTRVHGITHAHTRVTAPAGCFQICRPRWRRAACVMFRPAGYAAPWYDLPGTEGLLGEMALAASPEAALAVLEAAA
jgi:hypothetical protein